MSKLLKFYLEVVIVVLLTVVFLIFFSTAQVNGSSMYPTYKDGDFLFIMRTHNVNRYDKVAIFYDEGDELLCKRVIGVEKDHIVIKDGLLYINDILIDEPYANFGTEDYKMADLECTVPNNFVFVMGDNRSVSKDSRSIGVLETSGLVGKVLFKFPFSRKSCVIVLLVSILFDIILCKCKKKGDNNEQQSEGGVGCKGDE